MPDLIKLALSISPNKGNFDSVLRLMLVAEDIIMKIWKAGRRPARRLAYRYM